MHSNGCLGTWHPIEQASSWRRTCNAHFTCNSTACLFQLPLKAAAATALRPKQGFRRRDPDSDGPYLLADGELPARQVEMQRTMRLMMGGALDTAGPGAYDGQASKDALLRRAPAAAVRRALRHTAALLPSCLA